MSLPLTPQQIRDTIDQRLAANAGMVQAKQDAWLAQHGQYWQGLPTHTVIPADGVELPPDQTALKPAYEAADWATMGGLPLTMMSRMKIDQYLGPAGPGYVVTVEVMIGKELWARSINFGPEAWRDSKWAAVVAPLGL